MEGLGFDSQAPLVIDARPGMPGIVYFNSKNLPNSATHFFFIEIHIHSHFFVSVCISSNTF